MGSAASEITPSSRLDGEIVAPDANSDEIRADIEATRADLSDTVDAIQAKLSPSNVQDTTEQISQQVKDAAQEITEQAAEKFKKAALEVTEQATERVKDTVTEIRQQIKSDIHDATIGKVEHMANNLREGTRGASASLVTTIKENPIPAALVGFGLAWLFFSKLNSGSSSSAGWREDQTYSYDRDQRRYDRDERYGYNYGYNEPQDRSRSMGERAGDVASGVSNAASNVASGVSSAAGNVASGVSDAADSVKHKAGELVNQAQERVGMVGEQVKGQTSQVVNKSQTLLQENPLMAGAVALALGAAVGLMLPVTERENQLMGTTRDKFMDRAGGVVHDTMDKAQRVVSEATEAAKETVKREMQNEGSSDNQQTTGF